MTDAFNPSQPGPEQGPAVSAFDEQEYLRTYPDVAAAILRGDAASGLEHYQVFGAREGRELPPTSADPRGKLLVSVQPLVRPDISGASPPANIIDAVRVTKAGGVMIIGWAEDSSDPIDYVRVIGPGWRVVFDGPTLARVRRSDVESVLGLPAAHPFGYFGLIYGGAPINPGSSCKIEVVFSSKIIANHASQPRVVSDEELRNVVLSYLQSVEHFGNPQIKAISALARGSGEQILLLNRSIVNEFTSSPYVERFGIQNKSFAGSIIVCLYGKIQYLFLQAALFSSKPGIENYEFIYVSNSPELSELLLREAKLAVKTYGVSITVVILSGNAGFGAANNIAARFTNTDRILIVNPDVFPRDDDWAQKHTDLLESSPGDRTKLFGVPLYYDDGSLMHGGMYFEIDKGVVFDNAKSVTWQLLRVEHYGKGAPNNSPRFTRSRPVPAVTGAFISMNRDWFEALGGFSVDYVFGHYEDADLCLKSLKQGAAPWVHDLRLWHLEGKGSTRLPVHDGGSTVNRWVFSSRWGDLISAGLSGEDPWGSEFAAPIEASQLNAERKQSLERNHSRPD